MIHICESDGGWMIAWVVPHEPDLSFLGDGLTGSLTPLEGTRLIFGRCWNGGHWSKKPQEAKPFASRKEAEAYFTKWREIIESSTL